MEKKVDWDQKMIDTLLVCTTCEICNQRCSSSLPIEPSWMKLRGQLINEEKEMTFPPFEIMAASVRKEGNIWAGYRDNRTKWFPEELWEKHGPDKKAKIAYFAGCTASYVEEDIGQAAVTALDEAGVDFKYIGDCENCCGTPMLVAGKWDVFEEILRENIAMMQEDGIETITTSCPACDMMWRTVYPDWAKKLGIEYNIEVKHYTEILSEAIAEGKLEFRQEVPAVVTWHDSCHIGRASGVYEPPREVIKSIPGVEFREMAHNREDGLCCGSVLTLIKEPDVAKDIGAHRLQEAIDVGAEKVLALCPCCQFQLRVTADKTDAPLEVMDLAHLTCKALGHEFADPNPEVQRQWAVFEAMIALMTPQGFAELMDTMWEELLDAMPLKMGGMMRLMGKMGPMGKGMLTMMKPMFPILFPRLLPGMMPKVMPTMLSRVGDRIPMPDYMSEQMPELMPKVMDSLMPKMLPDVVPLVTPMMIQYLTASKKVADTPSAAVS
jgi:Fe-S oxidoreductase